MVILCHHANCWTLIQKLNWLNWFDIIFVWVLGVLIASNIGIFLLDLLVSFKIVFLFYILGLCIEWLEVYILMLDFIGMSFFLLYEFAHCILIGVLYIEILNTFLLTHFERWHILILNIFIFLIIMTFLFWFMLFLWRRREELWSLSSLEFTIA